MQRVTKIFSVLGAAITLMASAAAWASMPWPVDDRNWWIGTDGDWGNPDNWARGVVPGTEYVAVFDDAYGGEFGTITIPEGTQSPMGMAFLTEETVDLVRAGSGDFHLIGRPFFYHGAGAGAVSIDVVSGNILGGGYNLDQSEFRSDNPFVFRSHIRHDGTNFYFPRESKGSGTVRLEGGVSGMVWLAAQSADWTGTIVLPEGATWDSTRGAQVSHGTLVIDGTFRISSNTTTGRSFASAAGSLVTGHGTFGRTGFSVTFGGTLAPGRPGEVGTLNFDKSEGSGWVIPTTMESTSVLRFDLLNALSHDRLLWEGSLAVWNLTVVEGAQLELHLLEGFSAQPDDEFHILSGYDSLDGTLQLKDGTVLSENTIFAADAEGEHLFRISYGDGTGTTLTYIPEPGTAALLLAGALLTALRRRRGTTGVCGKS